jgi:Ser/Thr protein kinase RdoA (MazF antagonist)
MPLDLEGRPIAFVKVTQDPPNPLTAAMFDGLSRSEPGFLFPRIREVLQVGEWWVTLEDPLPQVPHKPARPGPKELHSVVSRIHRLVPQEHGDLRPAHGDLGPWNVRECVGVGLAILDWEYAAWAPVATDEVWHAITLRLATSRRSGESVGDEARDELRGFYSDAQLSAAAEFLANRWDEGEPVEIREATPKSKTLLRSERRLARALGQFMG